MTSFEQILEFNKRAGLLENEASPKLEASFQIEEALEEFELGTLYHFLSPKNPPKTPKEAARAIMDIATWKEIPKISKTKQVDKACDAIVFAVGHLGKLGLDAKGIETVLGYVNQSNLAKVSCPKDAEGKLTKPESFDKLYAPEPKIKAYLESAGLL